MKINYLLDYSFDVLNSLTQTRLLNQIFPMFEMQNNIIEENRNLTCLRDSLLPKLMSGEIDVSEIKIED